MVLNEATIPTDVSLKSTPTHDYNIPEMNVFLNKEEIDELDEYNEKSRKYQENKKYNTEFLNKSLNELIIIWSNTHLNIITDLTEFTKNIAVYSDYFNDLETNNIMRGIYLFVKDFLFIFVKKQRSIYVGITFILISLLFFFIGISS
tara:strand:- start:544 stop:984 length:441 start_codon:yes stop_codon:yes gene_type:complete